MFAIVAGKSSVGVGRSAAVPGPRRTVLPELKTGWKLMGARTRLPNICVPSDSGGISIKVNLDLVPTACFPWIHFLRLEKGIFFEDNTEGETPGVTSRLRKGASDIERPLLFFSRGIQLLRGVSPETSEERTRWLAKTRNLRPNRPCFPVWGILRSRKHVPSFSSYSLEPCSFPNTYDVER